MLPGSSIPRSLPRGKAEQHACVSAHSLIIEGQIDPGEGAVILRLHALHRAGPSAFLLTRARARAALHLILFAIVGDGRRGGSGGGGRIGNNGWI
jgi:predicted aconitase with swiveling domain